MSRAGAAVGGGLRVRGLAVTFRGASGPAITGLDLDLPPGRCVALVGESGSGKSVTARALLGLAGPGAQVRAEELSLDGRDLRHATERDWIAIRGRRIGLAVQDALVSLDPLRPVGREIADSPRLHERAGRTERRRRAEELLASLGVDSAAERTRQRAGQLSGGQRQRALIAAAISADPALLIADEPTSSLDALVQAEVLGVLRSLVERGRGLLLISHDLDLVAGIADHVLVLRRGRVVESGPAREVLARPREPYTRALLAAAPSLEPARRQPSPAGAPLMSASGLTVAFRRPGGGRLTALDDVSVVLRRGQTLGVMGASGSGKSTLLRALLGVQRADFGVVGLDGGPWSALPERRRRPLRRRIGYVPQDALGTMDPRWSVGRTVADALPAGIPRADRGVRVAELLERVGLDPALALRSPVTLSGGQRQRVAIARALAGKPEILLCDEPVSSLDVTVQSAVLDTLDTLQRDVGLAMAFVSHDLGVLARVSDRIAVMTEGRIVEEGTAAQVLEDPVHDYTRELVAAYRRARVKSGRSHTQAHP